MWDIFSTSDWTQTTWMRWCFGILIFVVGYAAAKILEELSSIRFLLQEIRDKLSNR